MNIESLKCNALELDTAQVVTGFYYAENGYFMTDDAPDYERPVVRHYIVDEGGLHREIAESTLSLENENS